MIHLRAEHWSALGDDTFWCWAEREFPGAVRADQRPVESGDQVLHYGLLGAPKADHGQTVALLWEQHPEMARQLDGDWPREIEHLHAAAKASGRRTVATPILADEYREHGTVDVLPIGVDTDLWRPADSRMECDALREQYGIPKNTRLGFWGGHGHPMKGYDLLLDYAADHPRTRWVVAFKRARDRRGHGLNGVTVAGTSQQELAGLMRMCDFALFTSRLRPYSMMEWEAMATNLPVVNVGHPEREFTPGPDPRDDVLARGWGRRTAKQTWLEYLDAG